MGIYKKAEKKENFINASHASTKNSAFVPLFANGLQKNGAFTEFLDMLSKMITDPQN